MATAPVHGNPGESFAHCFNEIAFNLVRGQFSQNRQFSLIVTLLSVPEFAFTLPLISAFLAVSLPSGVREKRRGIAGRGDTHRKQPLQEHVVHEQLIPLRHK